MSGEGVRNATVVLLIIALIVLAMVLVCATNALLSHDSRKRKNRGKKSHDWSSAWGWVALITFLYILLAAWSINQCNAVALWVGIILIIIGIICWIWCAQSYSKPKHHGENENSCSDVHAQD